MTTAATTLLGLALPVTGELSGTWGDTVNNSITNLLDTAVAGTTTLSTDVDVTLTTTTLASNQARQAILLCSGARTALRTITAPAQSKIYTIINATTGGFSVKLVGVGPTTGVTIVAGESALVAWNGSDFIKISNTAGAGVFSSITNTGLTSGRVVYSTTGGLETDSANLTFNGTTLTANTLNLTNALGTSYGGTGLTSFTANGVVYASSTSALATGSALTFDGNKLSVGNGTEGTVYFNGASFGLIRSLSDLYYDGNAQIFRNAAGSSEYMRLTSTGLGIGTSSITSGAKLDVNGQIVAQNGSTSSLGFAFRSATSSGMYLYDDGVGANVILQANANNNQLYLQRTGNVGIGTSSPDIFGLGSGRVLGLQGSTSVSFQMFQGSKGLYAEATASLVRLRGYLAPFTIETQGANALIFGTDTTERARIDSSGNFGIGTSSPSLLFQVSTKGGMSSDGVFQWGEALTGNNRGFLTWDANSGIVGAPQNLDFSTGGSNRARINSSGQLIIGATSLTAGTTTSNCLLTVGGTASPMMKWQSTTGPHAWDLYSASGGGFYFAYDASDKANINSSTGAYTATSDSRLKKSITDISYGLSDILKLRPVEYLMIEEPDDAQKHLGFIAQEAATVLPSSVSEFTNGYFGMDKTEIVAVLVKAIQEQQALIQQLTARVAQLEAKGA